MSYWLIAVPNEKPPRDALRTLQEASRGFATCTEFPIPSLKVGTLDSLMALSEELGKYDPILEGIAKKIERTYHEVALQNEENATGAAAPSSSSVGVAGKRSEIQELRIGDLSPKDYIEKFKWNELRYNKRTPLKQLSDTIIKEALKSDETLKKQQTEYNETRTSYSQIERVEGGSLLVRPLAPYVNEKDIIEREFLTTLLVVVPRARVQEFESQYEILEVLQAQKDKEEQNKREIERVERDREAAAKRASDNEKPLPNNQSIKDEKKHDEKKESEKDAASKNPNLPCRIVVPKSIKKLLDNPAEEFVLYRLVVLKKGAEYYKNLLRDRRCTVRPFKYEPEEEKKKIELKKELEKKKKNQYNFLIRWCQTTYVEVFVGWVHLKSVRLFVEAVLRYGLPVDFKSIIIDPLRNEKKVRAILKQLYGKLAGANANLTAALDPNEVDPSGMGEDFYPYVYLPLAITD